MRAFNLTTPVYAAILPVVAIHGWRESMATTEAEKSKEYRARKKAELALLPPEEAAAIIAEKKRKKAEYDAARYEEIGDQKRATSNAWYAANPERGKARSNARYAEKKDEILAQEAAKRRAAIEADPEYTKKEYQAALKRMAANPELYKATRRAGDKRRREADPERYQQASRDRYWADPEKSRERGVQDAHTRRARKLEAGGQFTAADIRTLMEKQKGKCLVCLKPFGKNKPHVDHYISLARGGTNDPSNLRLLCRKCNMAKHAKDPIEFGRLHGLLCW
jgi:5-methylcytosine-specific restriction endonuclease McrA